MESLSDCETEGDSNVLYRVVVVNMQVTFCFDSQIDPAVVGHEVDHVIEKAYASAGIRLRAAIEVDNNLNAGFICFPFDFSVSDIGGRLSHGIYIVSAF